MPMWQSLKTDLNETDSESSDGKQQLRDMIDAYNSVLQFQLTDS